MINPRKYGRPPYQVAVIHGGPGAAGEMAPVAKELSDKFGVVEPLQTKDTIGDQVIELWHLLSQSSSLPLTLIGYSWGAWLGILFTVKYPEFVNNLILISSGPFLDQYTKVIHQKRFERLKSTQKREFSKYLQILSSNDKNQMDKALKHIGELAEITDSYEKINDISNNELIFSGSIFKNVSNEASELRKSGKLLELTKSLECKVCAIHGDYDPHPVAGVKILADYIKNFEFILLQQCGHTPWKEKYAKQQFYHLLKTKIMSNN